MTWISVCREVKRKITSCIVISLFFLRKQEGKVKERGPSREMVLSSNQDQLEQRTEQSRGTQEVHNHLIYKSQKSTIDRLRKMCQDTGNISGIYLKLRKWLTLIKTLLREKMDTILGSTMDFVCVFQEYIACRYERV